MTEKQRKVVDKGIKEGRITLDEIAKVAADGSRERSEMLDELQSHNVIIANKLGEDMEEMLEEINAEEKPKAKRGRKPSVKKTQFVDDEDNDDDLDMAGYSDGLDDSPSEYELKEEEEEKEAEREKLEEEEEEENLDDSDFYSIQDEMPTSYNFEDILSSGASNSRQAIQADDSVRMYLKEIGRIDLLSKEEEYRLAKIVFDNNEIIEEYRQIQYSETPNFEPQTEMIKGFLERSKNDGQAYYVPTVDEAQQIEKLEHDKKIASNQLIEANLRLVVHIAKNFVASGMPFLDLIQEGSNGLAKAVSKFDYRRGNKFSTYATGWIKQAITRAIADQARTIRIPVHMNETINKLNRKEKDLTHELGRKPSVDELADAMDVPVDKIIMIKRVSQKTKSLEDPVGEEEDSSYGDFIPDEVNPNPEEYASNEALKKELNNLLSNLSDREERVIKLRFGLIDGRTRTLEEVGKEFGVTRERIRQIEAKALRKLRHPSRSNKLKDFIK